MTHTFERCLSQTHVAARCAQRNKDLVHAPSREPGMTAPLSPKL